jgi:hypothetical protein
MLSEPGQQGRTGSHILLGYCWVSGQLGGRAQIFPLQRRFLVRSWCCQGSFFPHQSRRCRHSSRTFRASWLAAPPSDSSSHHTSTHFPSRGSPVGSLRAGPPRRRPAAAVDALGRAVPGSGEVVTFFQAANGFQGRSCIYTSSQALSRSSGGTGRRTAAQGSAAEQGQVVGSMPASVVSFTPADLPFFKGPRSETPPAGFFRRSGRHLRAAAAASAASAARHQVRAPCPLNSQADTLHRLRTNIPSCKNADAESPTLK